MCPSICYHLLEGTSHIVLIRYLCGQAEQDVEEQGELSERGVATEEWSSRLGVVKGYCKEWPRSPRLGSSQRPESRAKGEWSDSTNGCGQKKGVVKKHKGVWSGLTHREWFSSIVQASISARIQRRHGMETQQGTQGAGVKVHQSHQL